MLASASEDNTVRLWNVESWDYVGAFEGHRGSVNSVVFSPDGRFLVSVGDDDTVKLWDAKSRHQIETLTGHSKNVKSVAFSSNGITLASGSDDGTIFFWDLSLFGATPDTPPTTASPQTSPELLLPRRPPYNALPNEILAKFEPGCSVYTVAFSPDGSILASGGDDSTVRLWNVDSKRELKTFTEHSDWVEFVDFSPDGRILASASTDGSVKLWSVYSHRKLATLKHDDWVESVAFSPNTNRQLLATSGGTDGSIKVWDISKKKIIATFPGHSGAVSSVDFSPDGRILASAGYDGVIKLWVVDSGREFHTLFRHSRAVYSVAFSPDGTTLASGSKDKTTKLWDVSSGEELATLEHERYVASVAFSPDGRLLASASVDYTIKLWTADGTRELTTLNGPKDGVTSIAFSPDGMTLASGSRDQTILLWDLSYSVVGNLPLSPTPVTPENPFITTVPENSELFTSKSETSQYKRDTTQPNISITSPTERAVSSTVKQIEVTGIATDDSGIYEVIINGTEATVLQGGRFNAKILLAYGDNEIMVTATDTQNNTATKRLTVVRNTAKPSPAPESTPFLTKDITGPEIRILSPAARVERGAKAKIRLTTNSTIITGTVTDPSGIYEVRVNDTKAQVSGNRFTATVQLVYGDNLIRVRATDKLRNTESVQITLTREEALHTKTGTDYALLFAADTYAHWPNLWNPLFDAEAIRADLQGIYGFQAELVHNPTREEILETLLKYTEKEYIAEDQLLIFFAGHGYFNPNFREGYLVAQDTKLSDDDITMSSYLSHSEFRNIIDRMSCKHIFLIMDTCYSGTFDQRIAMRGEAEDASRPLSQEDIKRKLTYTTRWYLTSGGKEKVSDGLPGHHSPFTREFLEALRSKGGIDNILTIDEVLNYLDRIKVPKPRANGFGRNAPGSDFLFIAK